VLRGLAFPEVLNVVHAVDSEPSDLEALFKLACEGLCAAPARHFGFGSLWLPKSLRSCRGCGLERFLSGLCDK